MPETAGGRHECENYNPEYPKKPGKHESGEEKLRPLEKLLINLIVQNTEEQDSSYSE